MYLFSHSGANSELDNQSVPDVDTSPSLETTLSQVRIGAQVHMIVCADVCARVQPQVLFFRSHSHVLLWR